MINSALWSFATQYGQMMVTFASSVILARLLSPEEIGIYSVSFALIGFVTLFRDFGVGDYLVQEKELTGRKLQTAFTLNNLVAWTLGCGVYFAAQPVAHFYGTPEISSVFHLLALNFVFVPLGAVTLGLLRRDMNFRALASIQLVGIVLTAIVTITAAWAGQSYLSMAWGAVAGSICTALLCQKYRSSTLSIKPALSEISSIWSYTSYNVLFSLVRHTNQSATEILAGKFLGMGDVGLLSKGRALPGMAYQLVSGGLKPLAMPEFSKIRADPKLLSIQYFKMVDVTVGAIWPCLLFIGVMAEEVVMFLFGEKWVAITPIVQISSVGAALWSTINYAEDFFKAAGRIKLLTNLEPVFLVLSVSAAALGSQFDIITIALLLLVVGFIRVMVNVLILNNIFSLKLSTYLLVIRGNLYIVVLLAIAIFISYRAIQLQNPFLSLLYNGSIYIVCWLILLMVTKHQIYQLAQPLIKNMLNSRWRS